MPRIQAFQLSQHYSCVLGFPLFYWQKIQDFPGLHCWLLEKWCPTFVVCPHIHTHFNLPQCQVAAGKERSVAKWLSPAATSSAPALAVGVVAGVDEAGWLAAHAADHRVGQQSAFRQEVHTVFLAVYPWQELAQRPRFHGNRLCNSDTSRNTFHWEVRALLTKID